MILSNNNAMKYGYTRVSTDDQKTDLEVAALKKADCQPIFTDTATGAFSKRPEPTHLPCIPCG